MADLSPEKAYSTLKAQLEKLQSLKGQKYQVVETAEQEWYQFTEKIVQRAFGGGSPNLKNFKDTRWAGERRMVIGDYTGPDHAFNQRNFDARLRASEAALRSSLAELEIDLPDVGIKGVYEPGQEYEFYSDVKAIVRLAKQQLFVIDPYLRREIFDAYASAIPRTVRFRLLGSKVSPDVLAHSQRYASGGNLEFRSSNSIHDRMIFADNRVWVCGQSIKDAAKTKPTYIVEHDESLMGPVYEAIWAASQKLI